MQVQYEHPAAAGPRGSVAIAPTALRGAVAMYAQHFLITAITKPHRSYT